MLNRLAVVALVFAAPLAAQETPALLPSLSLGQQTGLRCSAAFAMVAAGQAKGEADSLAFAPVGQRGREYFVRLAAQMMDEIGVTREQLQAMMLREASAIRNEGPKALSGLMPPCLVLLDIEVPRQAR